VSDGGFYTDDTGRYGASPDGNTSDGGILEVKCYDVVKHIKTILNDGPLEEDIPQIQGELLVSGKPHCHFYLYHPELPAAHFIVRPDHAYQEMLLQALNIFCNGVDYAYTILTKPKRK
jgi:hypothetical protein